MSDEALRSRQGKGEASTSAIKELSVVVPTYNETDNIRPLTERLFKAAKGAGLTVDLLFVDDESAGSEETEKIVKKLAEEGHPVRIHCRKKVEGRGLSSAVLLGFDKAKYKVMLCMDADLQHEPESVPAVAAPVLEGKAEFSVGSRHVDGGGLGFSWSVVRQIISRGATLLAWPLARSTDPMSGFFCTSKTVLSRGRGNINPIGFKIGLEIMVRCKCQTVQDVGIMFQERAAGESKLSAAQYKFYLLQLAALYWDKYMELFFVAVLLVFGILILVMTWWPHRNEIADIAR
mmetsp:Transcript_83845/g.175404  ORF Transcript_83845/g.175404 Transcript_83845/m.175404 type:complete len:290 (+) Transcript_83845:140-1009(+)|eukprot:CAMPEP_0206474922 /NCGR_PEP_ID=MMETSP0324_2-20121206/33776_1 /ASSEMBLY_ACC=CAM_ASM_000836 /TAXON_ID=2866 /ORGANISM="Crypthecodinium cohnii, Strain Seligo" /LENGTH=289 /DNA_ID=CAMNT_0053950189 /DNA_START=118 /DNA_END=987 /DNA_ORIENTATION=+